MSSKQLRKLRELQASKGATAEPEAAASEPAPQEESSSEDDGAGAGGGRAPGFAAFLNSESETEEESEPPEPDVPEEGASGAEAAACAAESQQAAGASTAEPLSRRKQKQRDREKEKEKAASAAAARSSAAEQVAAEDDDDFLELLENERADSGPEGAGQNADSADQQAALLDLKQGDFSVENERRRATGRAPGADHDKPSSRQRTAARVRGCKEGVTAHHRRLYLVKPSADEAWPRPFGNFEMVATVAADGSPCFDFAETPESTRVREKLQDCIYMEDPNLLHKFLQQNRFCIDGLLALAEHQIMGGNEEQAFQLVRTAVYAVECGFEAGFSPFRNSPPGGGRPCVAIKLVEDPIWPGWTWLRALWMYMRGLSTSGMHRTATSVCRLILAATLPRDPVFALMWLDFLCLRTRQFDLLAQLAEHLAPSYGLVPEGALSRLDLAFPNFAYSAALAGLLANTMPRPCSPSSPLNTVGVDHVIAPLLGKSCGEEEEWGDGDPKIKLALAATLRAMLIFPDMLRPLLKAAGANLEGPPPGGSTSRAPWVDLLGKRPFLDGHDFRHASSGDGHSRICVAYPGQCGALWKIDAVLCWLHACSARLVTLYESSAFAAELDEARRSWSKSRLCLEECLQQDFPKMLAAVTAQPGVLERSTTARVYSPPAHLLRHAGRGLLWPRQQQADMNEGLLPPNVSLHTPPLLLFLQTLLPWAELDRSGASVEPVFWGDLARGTFTLVKHTTAGIIEVVVALVNVVRELFEGGDGDEDQLAPRRPVGGARAGARGPERIAPGRR